MDEIADGNIHALNDKLAYMLLNSNSPFHYWDVEKIRLDMFVKYYDYLTKNSSEEGKFWFIERTLPHALVGPVHTVALKFERVDHDGI